MRPDAIVRWLEIAKSGDPSGLDGLLAENVVFQSPIVYTPQRGKAITTKYLAAALQVLGPASFRYVGEWHGLESSVLEFVAEIEGIEINGVDIIGWNAGGAITSFKVMVRPLKAMQMLQQQMAARLAGQGASG